VAVPAVSVQADPYASHVDPTGRSIFDQVLLHWIPDPTFAAGGYRITRWTQAGTTTTDYPAGTVRAVFPAGPAGYQVTALIDGEQVPSAPIWFPLPGQDLTPLYPVTSLRAAWTSSGGLALSWANPAENTGHADQYAVLLNGEQVASAEHGAVPGKVGVRAADVPTGDLVVTVMVGSSSSLDLEETSVALAARVPFSGTATPAGRGRYRVDLQLAPSRQARCGRGHCAGAVVTIGFGGWTHVTRLDSQGHAVVLGWVGTARRAALTVSVRASGRPALTDRVLRVPVR
jgi:hypothetical protein